MLILVSGSSGSGKNTIIQELINRNSNIKFLKSCTTRTKRSNESADTYIYLTKEEFDNKQKNDEIFECEEIHQNFYGLLNQSLEEVVQKNNENEHFIKDIGVLGQINLTRALKNKVPVLSVYLKVPKAELVKRLKGRGEKDIDLRISRMEFELSYVDNFDEVINNIDIEKTLARIEKLIAKSKKKQYNNELGK